MVGISSVLAVMFVSLGYTPDQIENVVPAVLVATPGFFAWASMRDRPSLLVAAAILGIVSSPMLWSAMPLLLIPSIVCLVAYARMPWPVPRPIGTTPLVVIVPFLLLLGAFVIFASGPSRQVCESLRDGSICSSTTATATIVRATLVALLAWAVGYWAATPTRPASEQPVHPALLETDKPPAPQR